MPNAAWRDTCPAAAPRPGPAGRCPRRRRALAGPRDEPPSSQGRREWRPRPMHQEVREVLDCRAGRWCHLPCRRRGRGAATSRGRPELLPGRTHAARTPGRGAPR
eukprot:15037898-Alexandrium_andersonii.AAC.1